MHGRRITTTAAAAVALLLGSSGAAFAAAPGETFPTALLPLPAGAVAGGDSGQDALAYASESAVSGDGRYVAFVTTADGLAPEAPLDVVSVVRKDRATGEVVLVSRADGVAGAASQLNADEITISDDGSRVGWVTQAPLDPADGDTDEDVYVRDLTTSQTLLASSFAGAGDSVGSYDLSGDGRWIVVVSEERLAAGDTNTKDDVYRVAVAGGAPLLASATDGTTTAGNDHAGSPSISGDGTWVAFSSTATDMVTPFVDGNGGGGDVYARDVVADRTYLVSNSAGALTRGGNQSSTSPIVAGSPVSGRGLNVTIAYTSYAMDVAPAGTDVNTDQSVYRRNLRPGFTGSGLVSRATGASGADASESAYVTSVSDDGYRIAFATNAPNLGVAGQLDRVWVRDAAAATTALGSVDGVATLRGAISGDGTVFVWNAFGGVTADSDPDAAGVFARSYATPPRALGAPELVSRPAGGAPFLLTAMRTQPAKPGERAISADGRYVIFDGRTSRDLFGLGSLPSQIYRRDTLTGALALVSRANGPDGAPVDDYMSDRSISGDGQRVVFSTDSALDPADTDAFTDVYVRDLATATTTLVSRADGFDGADADDDARAPRISADGTHVAFDSMAANLGTDGLDEHVYLRDLTHGRTIVVDRANGAAGAVADDDSSDATVSADGRFVAFLSRGTNLDPADPGPVNDPDVYVRDVAAGTLTLASRRAGADGQKSGGGSAAPVISADGRVVAYEAGDEALAPEGGAWAQLPQIVARDLVTHQNTLVSRSPAGPVADGQAIDPSIDDAGTVVAFASQATNLLPGVGGRYRSGVFARTLATGAVAGPPAFGLVGQQFGAIGPSLSGDGRCLAFTASGHNAFTGAAGDVETAYVHVLAGGCPPVPPVDGGPPRPPVDPRPPVQPRSAPKPSLSKASLLRARFRVGRGATAVAARTAKKPKKKPRATPAGTAIRFTLDVRATVTFAIERRASGRKLGRSCRRATRRLRRKPACTLWVKAGTLTRRGVAPGKASVAFSGRVGRRALAPGVYRVTLKAANAAGSSKPATLAFTVVRR